MPLFGKVAPNAQWDANIESDLLGYIIYYRIAPGPYTSSVNITLASLSSPLNPSYILSGLTPIQIWYYFAITAYDASGNESPLSAEFAYYVSDPSTREAIGKTVALRG